MCPNIIGLDKNWVYLSLLRFELVIQLDTHYSVSPSSQTPCIVFMQWKLVCDKQAMKRMSQSVYMGGLLVGGFLLGGLADK